MNSNRQIADNGNVSHLQLAEAALERYGLAGAALSLVSEIEATIYKVALPSGERAIFHPYLGRTCGQQLLLRIEDSSEHRIAATYSELVLLATLLRDTDLVLPEPVPASSGELVPELWLDGMERPHQCVLFRWPGSSFPEHELTMAAQWKAN